VPRVSLIERRGAPSRSSSPPASRSARCLCRSSSSSWPSCFPSLLGSQRSAACRDERCEPV